MLVAHGFRLPARERCCWRCVQMRAVSLTTCMETGWIDVERSSPPQTGTEAIAPRPWDRMRQHTGINIYMAASIAGPPPHPPMPPIVGLVTASWVHASESPTRQDTSCNGELPSSFCSLDEVRHHERWISTHGQHQSNYCIPSTPCTSQPSSSPSPRASQPT